MPKRSKFSLHLRYIVPDQSDSTASDANEPVPTIVIADLDLDDLEDLEG